MRNRISEPAKTFTLHWGGGVIEEELQVGSRYRRPTIQLLKFTEGAAVGTHLLGVPIFSDPTAFGAR